MLLDSARRLARDAITMPVLGRYVTDYHRQLVELREKGRQLAHAQAAFNEVVRRFAREFGNRCSSPDCYEELLESLAAVTAATYS